MYTSGVWNVKAGSEREFARAWQASVDRLSLEVPGVVYRLLRNAESPSRFVSIVGPWRNREQFEAIRDSEEFQQFTAAVSEFLDSFEISSYDLVVEVS